MHNIALVDQPYSDPPGDRRGDGAIIKEGARIVDRALIKAHLGFELRDQGTLGIDLLVRHRVRFDQIGVALEIEPGICELRLVDRLLGNCLIKLRLVGGGIDARQDIATLNVVALAEIDADQLAIDLAAHGHQVECTRGANPIEVDRDVGDGGLRDQNGYRALRSNKSTPHASRATPAPATSPTAATAATSPTAARLLRLFGRNDHDSYADDERANDHHREKAAKEGSQLSFTPSPRSLY